MWKGAVFFALILLSGIVGIFPMFIGIPLVFINVKWNRKIGDLVADQWFSFVGFVLEYACGVDYVLTGDSIAMLRELNENSVVICNHRCRLDWLFLWPWFFRLQGLSALKIILKGSLKSIPVFGWGMQGFQFLFLQRKWEQDQPHMSRMLRFYRWVGSQFHLLVFPEGTDLSPQMVAKSHEYSKQNKRPLFHHVLYPRVTGFAHLLSELRPEKQTPKGTTGIGGVYDLTIGYVDFEPGKRPTEMQLLRGAFPRAVHVDVKRYAIDDMPVDTAKTGEWLEQRFAEKESRLSAFYNAQITPQEGVFPNLGTPQPELSSTINRYLVIWVIWSVVLYVFYSNVFQTLWFRLLVLAQFVVFTILDRRVGGVQNLELSHAPA